MMNLRCAFCPYISGQLQKHGPRGSILLLLCAFSALCVYLRLWIHIPLSGIFVKVSSKLWCLGGYMSWKRRAPSNPEPSPQLEPYLTAKGAKWTRSIVQAKAKREDQWQCLSNLDRVVNPTFSSLILYYYVSNSMKECGNVAVKLKESLAEVLSKFYPLAGRLEVREDGLVELHCNNAGAVVLEVYVDQDLRAFKELRPTPALSGLNSNLATKLIGKGPPYLPDQLRPMPVLIVQLTRFKCGSICLGANWHHTVADGSSGCHFMMSWAEMASGKGISLEPDHSRYLVRPRKLPDSSKVNTNGYSTKGINEDFISSQDSGQKPAVVDVVYIASRKVEEIKRQVKKEARKYRQYATKKDYTTVECLSAYLWRAFTRSRYADFSMQEDRDTKFFMFVDGRDRLKLPKGYFGNVVCSACALTTEKRLDSEPLVYAAYLIRKAVEGVSGDYFQSLIDWVEEQGIGSSKSQHVNSLGRDVAATFWNRFPIYRMDFGWGEPAFGARNSPPREFIDGFAVMPNNTGAPGDMVALVNLHGDRLERLQQEESFRRIVNK